MGEFVPAAPGSSYLFTVPTTQAEKEAQRLNMQHQWLKKCACNGRLIYDESIEIQPKNVVLDAATGTGAWLLDLSSQVSSDVELYGIDVSTKTLPESHPSNVKFVQGSVTSLPSEWAGKFDLVNQRLLIAALQIEEWPQAISEIYRTLKPGGYAQFLEYSYHRPEPTKARKQFRGILNALFDAQNLTNEIGDNLPTLLAEAGFVSIERRVAMVPIAASAGEDGKIGRANFVDVWRNWKSVIMKYGGFGLIDSEEEYDALLDTIFAEHEDEKTEFPVVLIYAQKPSP